MDAMIVNQGGCPKIAGTRITVYDIMDYPDWTDYSLAFLFQINHEQVRAARRYIEEHKDEVTAVYQRILARDAAGNPPELRARLEETHRRVQEMIRQRRADREAQSAGTPGGCKH